MLVEGAKALRTPVRGASCVTGTPRSNGRLAGSRGARGKGAVMRSLAATPDRSATGADLYPTEGSAAVHPPGCLPSDGAP